MYSDVYSRHERVHDRGGHRFVETWEHDSYYTFEHDAVVFSDIRSVQDMTDELFYEYSEGDELESFREAARIRLLRPMGLRNHGGRGRDWLYFDWMATYEKAAEEGWGMGDEWRAANPGATKDDEAKAATDRMYEYVSGWYDDDWHYTCVTVTMLGPPDVGDIDYSCVGGIESTDAAYAEECVNDIINELLANYRDKFQQGEQHEPATI